MVKLVLPKISVITVNFNNAYGLSKTIESVKNQEYNNLEYIIIDGGSTDDSIATIENNDSNIDYSVSEKDFGIYDAMNKGLNKASGKWCIFLNSGDSFQNSSVLKNFVLYANDDYAINFGDIVINDQIQKQQDFYNSMGIIKMICHQAIFFNLLNPFRESISFNIEYKICADLDLLIYLSQRFRSKFSHKLDMIVCNYEKGGVSDQLWVKRILERKLIIKKRYSAYFFRKSINQIHLRLVYFKLFTLNRINNRRQLFMI